jgi:hypothetical protein
MLPKMAKTAVKLYTQDKEKGTMTIKNPVVNKVFNDLDTYRDYCRFEGKVFNEKALYNRDDPQWQAYQKYCNWLRAKARAKGRK